MTIENSPQQQPTQAAPSLTADVGAVLKTARLKTGQTLEIVAQKTRIPRKLLAALESNQTDTFPAPAYLRGFLQNYCDYLELEFEPLWTLLFPPPPPPTEMAEPNSVKDKEPERHASPSTLAREFALGFDASSIGAVAFAVVLAAFVALRLILPGRNAKDTSPAVPAALEPLQQKDLVLVSRRETWIKVTVDGDTRFEGRVPSGSKQEWKARKSLHLHVLNPQDIDLSVNNTPYELGKPDSTGEYRIE